MAEGADKQNPLTVVPNASILLLHALMIALAESSPETVNKIRAKLELWRKDSLGKNNPGSFDLLDAMFKDLGVLRDV